MDRNVPEVAWPYEEIQQTEGDYADFTEEIVAGDPFRLMKMGMICNDINHRKLYYLYEDLNMCPVLLTKMVIQVQNGLSNQHTFQDSGE